MARFYSSPGFCDEELHLFLATELTAGPPHPQGGERLRLIRMPLPEAATMAERGEVRDAKTIIGLLLAERRLREQVRTSDKGEA